MKAPVYLVAGSRSWCRAVYETELSRLEGRWCYVSSPQELTGSAVRSLEPRYVFFLHWSWKVPAEIVQRYECVCFHMTDVPYGRGGSPLQNLIVRGQRSTKLTALRMTEHFDAGPVYLKEELTLEGSADEIYLRASKLAARMIERIVAEHPIPVPQTGDPTVFRRRTPAESRIPEAPSLDALYDFIRMLDAEGYPPAFLEHGGFRYEFTRASRRHDRLVADVTITPAKREDA